MILCITHSGDFYTIDLVMKAIADSGYEPFRFNVDKFNHQAKFAFGNKDSSFNYAASFPEWPKQPNAVKAVWNRKHWAVTAPEELDQTYENIFRQEYHTYRHIFLDSLASVPWMNPEENDRKVANNKLAQLEIAQQCGLRIPESLFTNDSEQLLPFFYECCKGKMIAKLHGVLSVSMQGTGQNFPTTLISEQDLITLPEQLPYCPLIFQEYIPKAFELRIAYVDGFCFAGKVNPGGEAVDWRGQQAAEFSWLPFELPAAILGKIQQVMQQAGLLFGVLDMIVTPNEEYVFLEINPKGEWGMLQKYLDYPIAKTIVQQLISKIPN